MDDSLKKHPGAKLPVELHGMIVDELQGDKAALAQCSLVSSAWSRRSLPHLFHTLHITPEPEDRYFSAFRSFVKKKSPLLDHVVRLELCGGIDLENNNLPYQCLSKKTLIPILRGFPKLAELHLSDMALTRMRGKQDAATHGLRLARLEIDNVADPSSVPNGLLSILQLFEHVSVLRLDTLVLNERLDRGERIGMVMNEIEIGSLDLTAQIWALELLCNSPVDSLTSLRFESQFEGKEELVALGHLLRKVGSHIEDLSLDMLDLCRKLEYTWRDKLTAQLLGIEECTALKTFEAVVRCEDAETYDEIVGRDPHLQAWISHVRVLEKLPKSLECIHFKVILKDEMGWLRTDYTTDWEEFRDAIEQFTALKSLRFTFVETVRWEDDDVQLGDDCADIVETELLDADKHGILECLVIPAEMSPECVVIPSRRTPEFLEDDPGHHVCSG